MSSTGVDFNASNLIGVLVGNRRSLAMSVPIVDDDIDEEDEFFAILLELVSAVNPDRVDLSERNISLLRIYDNDGEFEMYMCLLFCNSPELVYVECIIQIVILFLPTSPISLFSSPSTSTHIQTSPYHLNSVPTQ